MDFPSLGINFDLTQVVQAIRTMREAEQALLRLGGAQERVASQVEAGNRRIAASVKQGAEASTRAARGTGKTVEQRQYDAAVAAINGRMAFARRMGAQRLSEERREAAESIATERAVGTAAQQTLQLRMRLTRQRAQEAASQERIALAATVQAERQAQQAAQQTAAFRMRLARQRAGEEKSAAREAAQAQAEADRASRDGAALVARARRGMADAAEQAARRSMSIASAEAEARVRVTQAELNSLRQSSATRSSLQQEAALVDRLTTELNELAAARGAQRAAATGMNAGLATASAGAGLAGTRDRNVAALAGRQQGLELEDQANRSRRGLSGLIQTIGQYLGFMPRATRETSTFGGALNGLNRTIGGVRNTFLNARFVVAAFLGAMAVGPIIEMVDAMTALDARIGIYADNAASVPYTFEALYQAAQTSRQPLEAIAVLYSRLAPLAKQLGKSQMDLVGITETVAKSFAISGATASEAASSSQQLAQALASNRLGGDELRSLAENAPVLMNEIARALDMNVGQFIKWAQAGKANAAVVLGAIEEAKTRIDTMFAAMPVTIGQSITVVSNAMAHLVDRVNQMTGTSEQIAGFIGGFGAFLEAESTINGAATAIEVITKTFSVLGDTLGYIGGLIPAVAAGFAAFAAIQTIVAIVTALSKAFMLVQASAAIAGGRMVALQGIMAATAIRAQGLFVAMGGMATLLTGGLVLAVVAAVAAFTTMKNAQEGVAKSAEMLKSSQEGALGAIQRAISFSETYGLSTAKLDKALQDMGGSSVVAANATDATSVAHAKALTQALGRANAERVLTRAILTRAAAEAGSAADEADKAIRGGLFGIGGLEQQANIASSQAQRERRAGRNDRTAQGFYGNEIVARRNLNSATETRTQGRQQQRELNALAEEFNKPLTAEDIVIPNVGGTPQTTPTADKDGKGSKGLDGAINRIAKLREEVEGLNEQITALLANPLDPLADFAARIAAAGDEAAAGYTAGSATGMAEQARQVASQKEELQIRLQLLQSLVQTRRASEDEIRVLALSTAAREAQNATMSAFWASGNRSAAGYAQALQTVTRQEVEGLQAQESLRIARQYGVDSLDDIAEAYARATGASQEDAQALEDQAKAAAAATGRIIALTRAEEDAAAAATASLSRRQLTADTNAYADALGRGTEALAEYNRQARIRAAIDANKGLNPVAAENEVNSQIASEDRQARAERLRTFQQELELAGMTTNERNDQAVAQERVAAAIARGSQDTEELNLAAQKARAAYERIQKSLAEMGAQIRDDIRQNFIETGKIDFTSLKEGLTRRIREAVYDALLAKPIDMIVKATLDFTQKGLDAIMNYIKKALGGGEGDSLVDSLGKFFGQGGKFGNFMSQFGDTGNAIAGAMGQLSQIAPQIAAAYQANKMIVSGLGSVIGLSEAKQANADKAASFGLGPIGALLYGLFADTKRALALTAIQVQDGKFVSAGTKSWDGGPQSEIDEAGRALANSLNKIVRAFDLSLKNVEGLYTVFGWTAGENPKALGGEGFFGGLIRDLDSYRNLSLEQIKASALSKGFDVSQSKDAESAIDRILRETVIRIGEAQDVPFTEAEKALIRAADSLEEAAETLKSARNIETDIERALLRFTNPTEYALSNLRDQQIERRAGIRDLVDQGLVTEDRLPGIEALLQQLERNEIAEALANLATGADGAAASLAKIQEAQEKIRAYVDGLRTGQLSPLAPAAQLNLSRERFDDLLGRAQGGDLDALQTITDSSTEFLAAARQFYGSSEAYASIFDTVYNALDALSEQEFTDPLIDAIETQIQRLIDAINRGFGLFYEEDDDDDTGPTTPPPVTPPVVPPPPPVVGGGGGGYGGGYGGGGGERPNLEQYMRGVVDTFQTGFDSINGQLAAHAEAVVTSNNSGTQRVVEATVERSSAEALIRGGTTRQAA